MSDLSSAPVPGLGPEDRVRGPSGAPLVLLYADFECHFCALVHSRLAGREVRLAFRHFPVRSQHPRAWPAAAAAEAAALQGRFWEMHDSLFADRGRLEDPHLWARAQALGLDLARFDADRRSDAVQERVRRELTGGLRAGVATTPTLFIDGNRHAGMPEEKLLAGLAGGGPDRA